jgi:hypothetical protein
MTIPSQIDVAEMRALRQGGANINEIAAKAGIKPMTAYQRLRRAYGTTDPLPGPCNDNNPNRVTRMSARNGGCSTVSGLMPVTLRRLACIDGAPGGAGCEVAA